LPEFKLLYSFFKSSPVMLKCLVWESCTDQSFNKELATTVVDNLRKETGDEF